MYVKPTASQYTLKYENTGGYAKYLTNSAYLSTLEMFISTFFLRLGKLEACSEVLKQKY